MGPVAVCRFAAYAGEPVAVSTVVYDAPRSLQEQAYAPRQQLHGQVNVDGTGVGWWWADAPEPLRFRSAHPPWGDPNLPALAPRLLAGRFLAAVRSATPGIGLGTAFTHPFTRGRLAGTHNGWIGAWRQATARALTAALPDELFGSLTGLSDSQVLFLHAADRYEHDHDLGGAAVTACETVARACAAAGAPATLNLLIGDGEAFAATRMSFGDAPVNSLWVLEDGAAWPGAAVLASEPLDEDRGWRELPPGTVTVVSDAGVQIAARAVPGDGR